MRNAFINKTEIYIPTTNDIKLIKVHIVIKLIISLPFYLKKRSITKLFNP